MFVFVCVSVCPVRNMHGLVSCCRPGCIDWSRKCWCCRAARRTTRPDPLKLKTCTEDRSTFTTLLTLASLSLSLYCIALQCTSERNLISKLYYTSLNCTEQHQTTEHNWNNLNRTEVNRSMKTTEQNVFHLNRVKNYWPKPHSPEKNLG